MANNANFKLEYKMLITDGGSLQKVSNEVDKSTKAINRNSDAHDKLDKKRDHYNRREKGVSQGTSNTTKSFSKMSQTMSSGLVPAYAVLAANIFALSAAFGALSRAAQFEQLQQGLQFTGNAAGVHLLKVANGLRDITGAAVSAREAMSAVAIGVSAGFSSSQLEGLTKVAKGASLALGRDMEDALSRLTRGAAKLEPEILDELGIMVKLTKAMSDYGVSINKRVEELSQFERRQAFVNAIISEGEAKFGDLADAVDPTPYDQLASAFRDVSQTFLKIVNVGVGPVIKGLAQSSSALTGVLAMFGSTVLKQMVPSLEDMNQSLRESKRAQEITTKQQISNFKSMTEGSAAVQKLRKNVLAGTDTMQQWTTAQRHAGTSLKVNIGWLNSFKKGMEKSAAQIKKKAADVAQARIALHQLTAAIYAKNVASNQENVINAINFASQGKMIAGYHALAAAIRGQTLATANAIKFSSGFTKAMYAARGAMSVVAISAKTLGAAFTSILPIIGQVMFVFGLLKDFVFPLFAKEASNTSKILESSRENTENFKNISQQLSTVLAKESVDSVKAYAASLKALSGVSQSSLDIMDKYVGELRRIESEATSIKRDIFGTIFSLEGLAQLRSGGGFKVKQKSEEDVKAENLEVLKAAVESGKSSLMKYKDLLDQTSKSGNVSEESLSNLREKVSELSSAVSKASLRAGRGIFKDGDVEAIRAADAAMAALAGTLNSIVESNSEFSGRVNELFNSLERVEGPLSKQVDLLTEFTQKIRDSGGATEAIANLTDAAKRFGSNVKLSDIPGLLKIYEKYNTVLLENAKMLKEVKARATALTEKGDRNSLIKAQEELQRGYLRQLAVLNEVRALELQRGSDAVATSEEILKLEREISQTRRRVWILAAKFRQEDAQAIFSSTTALNEQLNVQENIVKELNDQRKLRVDIARITNEGAGLGRVSKAKEFEFEARAARAKVAAAAASLEYTRQSVSIEMQMAEAKLAVAAAQFNSDLVINDQERASMIAQANLILLQEKLLKEKVNTAKFELDSAIAATKLTSPKSIGDLDTKAAPTQTFFDLEQIRLGARNALKAAQDEISTSRAVFEEASLRAASSGTAAATAAAEQAKVALNAAIAAAEQLKQGSIAWDELNWQGKIQAINLSLGGMIEGFKELGPEGELGYAISEGALNMTNAFMLMFETIEEGGNKTASVLMGVASVVSAMSSIMAASSDAKIAGIDREIDAEKRRDGKSAASVQKLAALEKKKEQQKKKAFEENKKMQMANVVINTAAAVAATIAQDGFWAIPLAVMVGAMGLAQLAIIQGTSYQGGASGGGVGAPASVSIGERSNSIDLAASRSPAGELAYFRGESGAGTGNGTNFVPGGFTGRATGGNTAFMVGEQGPELFIPKAPGRVASASETENLTSERPVTVQFNINAIDGASVEQMLRDNTGMIIGNIREAANSRGTLFLEDINTSEDNARFNR